MTFKIGSLFDGSGGFPLAASLAGGIPVWASEVEPYPIAVTRSRFPGMKHLGDINKINGAEIEPVDVITFGSPCQDLSVAGKRAGLKHETNGDEETTRSGLFMEAVRIIKGMRESTNGRYPTYALWENVPGAFSSNKGEDFRTVLEKLIKIVEPSAVMPAVPKNGWAYADSYIGDGWSLAYRVFDAQYWGVPQRRRRIYLVLDLRCARAGKILFEREGVRGYFETGRAPWKGSAGEAAGSVDNCCQRGVGIPCDIIYAIDQQGGKGGANYAKNVMPTICSDSHGTPHAVAYALQALGKYQETDKASTLKGRDYKDATDLVLHSVAVDCRNATEDAEQPVYCLQGNGIDRADTAGCNGKGWREDQSYTLNTIDRPAVAYLASGKETVGTLMANMATKCCLGDQEAFSGDYHIIEQYKPRYIIRRLTPTECARLQGFPALWGHPDKKDNLTDEEYAFWSDVRNTHAAINGKTVKGYTKDQMLTWYNRLHADSAEYKMWGNGIALPPALYCMQGIADALEVRSDG